MEDFSLLLRGWYDKNKRDLPWRNEENPYYIWLSEIILQQTQVVQGMAYYLKFKTEFPNVTTLAESSEEKVLKLWQGLGYYSRARNLHHAAKQIIDDYGGAFPDTYDEIIKLKGVGEYTAAAISSFAFGEVNAVVDGNVFRVLSRIFKIDTATNTGKGKKEFTTLANQLIDSENPADHNQAMMELGALVCKPKNPDCINCPLQSKCLSYADNTKLDFPFKEKKLKVKERHLNYLIITDQYNLLINKREGKGIWQGLYDFPLIESDHKLESLKGFDSYDLSKQYLDVSLKHILTHQRLFVSFWVIPVAQLNNDNQYLKTAAEDLENYPLPQLIVRYINESNFFKR